MSHSLQDLLMLLQNVDDELITLGAEDMHKVIGNIKDKADDLTYVKDKMESEIARLKGLEVEVRVKRQAIEHSLDRLKEYITTTMRTFETEVLHGDKHTLRVKPIKSISLRKDLSMDEIQYLDSNYIGAIKYSVLSSVLKDQIKKEDKEKFYETKESFTTTFKVRKK